MIGEIDAIVVEEKVTFEEIVPPVDRFLVEEEVPVLVEVVDTVEDTTDDIIEDIPVQMVLEVVRGAGQVADRGVSHEVGQEVVPEAIQENLIVDQDQVQEQDLIPEVGQRTLIGSPASIKRKVLRRKWN